MTTYYDDLDTDLDLDLDTEEPDEDDRLDAGFYDDDVPCLDTIFGRWAEDDTEDDYADEREV